MNRPLFSLVLVPSTLFLATGFTVAQRGTPLPPEPLSCFTEVSRTLSGDTYGGRGVGTSGLAKAADTIDAWMSGIALSRPNADAKGQGGGRQPFEVVTGVAMGKANSLTTTLGAAQTRVDPATDWVPAGFSSSRNFTGDLVFAGFGIRAKDLSYDDYAGIDVKGKVVLAMRFEPGEDDEKSPFEGKRSTRFSELRTKAIVAREAGAAALILVGPAASPDDPDKLPPLAVSGPLSDAGIPVLFITRAQADRWLSSAKQPNLAELRAGIDATTKPASRVLAGLSVSGTVDLVPTKAEVQNIVGTLPGAGALASEVVVLGAHYDHLGMGGDGSFEPQNSAIHNGADDNASGVAGILCAAAELARNPSPGDRRTLVIAAFTAEEIGLGGSAYYVQHPLVGKLADTTAMINLDMVGRVREGKLSLLGADSSPGWKTLIEAATAKAPELSVTAGGDGYGPSDHSSFYSEGVPVVHLFSGAHEQYHTSADDFSTLDLARGGEVVSLTTALVREALQSPRLPYARSVAGAPSSGDSRGYGASLGTIPDYSAMEAKTGGVKLSGVRPASAAEKAGIQKGDVIVAMAGMDVQNLYDMTYVLREHKPGETIDVVVTRGDARIALKATLASRSPEAPKVAAHVGFSVGADAATPSPAGAATPSPAGEWQPKAGKPAADLARSDEPRLADLRRLTFGGENAEAYWSPDGRKLMLQRTPPGGGCDAQYTLNLDTGEVSLVSSGKGRTTCGYYDFPKGETAIYATTVAGGEACPPKPDYSKGYTWALYDSYDIVRDDLAGNRSTLISSPGYDAEATQCMKDGRIVFTSTRDGDLELYSAKADGSSIKRLTSTPGYDGGAFFTPDCKRLIWRASRPEGTALAEYQALLAEGFVRPSALEIFVGNANGKGVKQLTKNGAANFGPYPTPDGKGVLFSSNVGANGREFDLWFVDWKGQTTRITTAPGFDGFPMFSPDGKWLVFASNRATAEGANDTDLYVARWVNAP